MQHVLDSPEALNSSLAGGVFYRCDRRGLHLLSAPPALVECLGVALDELEEKLGAVLGRDSPALYAEIFDPASDTSTSIVLPYTHPSLGKRWLSLRRSPEAGQDGGVLVFLRDETILHESLHKVSSAQSREVENSARLQAAVLMEGHRHSIPCLDYQTTTIPSKLVDGDFLDVLRLSGRTVDFLLGDVMGKGMGAAIMGAMIKFSFTRALSASLFGEKDLPDPARICQDADGSVVSRLLERQSFATLTYARYEEEARVLRFVDCGHTSIIHHSVRTGECWRVKGGNMPLGFVAAQDYRSLAPPHRPRRFPAPVHRRPLRVLQPLGRGPRRGERVAYILRTYSELPASELAGIILKLGFAYSASGFNDDVSIVCVKDLGEFHPEPILRGVRSMPRARARSASPPSRRGGGRALGRGPGRLGARPRHRAARSEIILALHEVGDQHPRARPARGPWSPCELRWRYRLGPALDRVHVLPAPTTTGRAFPKSPLNQLRRFGLWEAHFEQGHGQPSSSSQGFHDKKRLVMCRRTS